MTREVFRRSQALRDVVQIAQFISKDSIEAADRFMENVESSLQFLLDFPESGELWHPTRSRYPELRTWQVKGFPNHLIFFRPTSSGIEVIRVCHAAKDVNKLFE